MTIAEYIADQLVNCGVKYVFGIPGGPSIPYLEAFKKAGIEFILTSHEYAAGLGYDPVEYNYESWLPDVPLAHFDTLVTDMPENLRFVRYAGLPSELFRVLKNLNSGALIFESGIVKGVRDEMESVFNGFISHFGPVTAGSLCRPVK